MKKIGLILLIAMASLQSFAQSGIIKGKVKNAINNEVLPSVVVVIQGSTVATTTGFDGFFELKNLKPGFYNVEFKLIGFKKKLLYEIQVNNLKASIVDIELEEDSRNINTVEVTAKNFYKPAESPVSLRTIGVSEIKRNPGGGRDISKVIQSLPGVASSATFRNDIIIRGGAPNENKFYLDGIEIPNINHFATQGSTGGPVGLINVDFVREVDFYSGAFPANRGNSLSSIFDFKFKDGRNDKQFASMTVGSSDLALVAEGPINSKTTYMASYRKSYLQFLFRAIGLPFLPEYNDFQFKVKSKIDDKNEITFIGLGALDDFSLNLDANETETQKFQLETLPVFLQSNYTIGVNYKHYKAHGYSTVVLSRNYLKNTTKKYKENSEDSVMLLNYASTEIENKIRIENTSRHQGYKFNYGISAEQASYTNDTYQLNPFGLIDYTSTLNLIRYGAFAQIAKGFVNDRLQLSSGLRLDGNNFATGMSNPLDQLSPRFSAAYALSDKWSLNFNTGIYYQTPAYTVLGYRDTNGILTNTNVKYISVKQVVGGIEYNTLSNLRFTAEGFYKGYANYPMLLSNGDTIPLANLGIDFGVVGNKPVAGLTKGRSYGVEFLAQQKLNKGFYGIVALTLVHSEFNDKNNKSVVSSWDSKYIVSLTAGKILKRNWELGLKLRSAGGAPYTPFNKEFSSVIANYNANPAGFLDNSKLNTNRLPAFYQLDARIDKKYNFKKWNLNVFIDITNLTNVQLDDKPIFVLDRDAAGNKQIDPNDPSKYKTKLLADKSGSLLSTIGIIIEI